MFRLSHYMREIAAPSPLGPLRTPPGPVVIWNLIRRCNLTCKHCYSVSADIDFPNELTLREIHTVMDDLRGYGVPVLILSGGEPLMHPHILDISRRAKAMGFYVALSSNGTRITAHNPAYENLIGAARNARNGQVVSLLVGRKIADIALSGLPHLGSGITWDYQGKAVMATPNLKEHEITVIEMGSWRVVKRIATLGPGFFMRSHDNTRYAWADVFFGKHRDAVHVIDKATLEIAATLRPSPGKTAAHVEFTRDGRHALLSIWDMDGALVVYDAQTLREVKRLPMVKPSGKYNVYNKITRERGTSH